MSTHSYFIYNITQEFITSIHKTATGLCVLVDTALQISTTSFQLCFYYLLIYYDAFKSVTQYQDEHINHWLDQISQN